MADTKVPDFPKTRGSRRYSSVDSDILEKKFITVLMREANRLLDESYAQKLSDASAKNLINYLKLLKFHKEQELEDLEGMTDEELEKHAKKTTITKES